MDGSRTLLPAPSAVQGMPGGGGGMSALVDLVLAYPGPAALVAAGGDVLAANAAADPVLDLMSAEGRSPGAYAREIVDSGAARTERLTLPGTSGSSVIDLTSLPAGDAALLLGHDLTLDLNLQRALSESRQRYKDLVQASSDFAWETDADGVFVFVSPGGALGWSAQDLVGRRAAELLEPDPDGSLPPSSPFQAGTVVTDAEAWFRRSNGASACLAINAIPCTDAHGQAVGMRGICRDRTEARLHEAKLAEAHNHERLLGHITRVIRDEVDPRAMLAGAVDAVALALGGDGCRIWRKREDGSLATVAAFGILPGGDEATAGWSEADKDRASDRALGGGSLLSALTRYRQTLNGRLGLWRAEGRAPWSAAERSLLVDVAVQIGIAFAQIEQHETLTQLASTDQLTRLLNRRSFVTALADLLAESERNRRISALLYLDLNNFKLTNDRLGHQRGDEALRCFGRLLGESARIGDLVARLGGDEFALWLRETDAGGAAAKAQAILELKERLAEFTADPARPLSPAIGVAIHLPSRPESVEALLARADSAMYSAKRSGLGIAFAGSAALPTDCNGVTP